MYLKEKLIRILKIKNAVLALFTILNLITGVSWELYLVIRYWGDWFTIAHAKATPDFIFWIIVGPVILLIVYISKEAFIFFGLMPLLLNRVIRIRLVMTADAMAKFFSTIKVPFVAASRLPAEGRLPAKRRLSLVRRAMRKGYLRHCTIEKHNGVMQVALAKKIVKDSCPSCGAPITGAVYSDYVCRYCDRKIMDVVVKK